MNLYRKQPREKAPWTRAFPAQAEALNNQSRRDKPAFDMRQRRPIPRRSAARQADDRIYRARVAIFLKLPENSFCRSCAARGIPPKESTQVHHKFGRGHRGELLMVEKYWVPCCSTCHPGWIHHTNPGDAQALGLLAPKTQFNNPPRC